MTDEIATLERGRTLDSRYQLVRPLGSGGMASVWLAVDDVLARSVAVKIIAEALAADPMFVTRFRREVRALAALSHPNIVRIFDSGGDHEREFFVMEYVPGGTLDERLARAQLDGVRPDVERLARELLAAARHIHDAGVVHRDIKPSNVLLARDGSPRLTDFGIAYAPEATRLTNTGLVIGSARYLAPEVLDGAPATPRSDLFSLGRLLAEVDAASYPRSHAVSRLVASLTQLDPARRPRSASDALELLDRHASPLRARAPRAPRGLATATTLARKRSTGVPSERLRLSGAVVATVAALALLVTLVVLSVSLSGRSASAPAGERAPAQPPPRASLRRELGAIGERISFAAQR